MHTPSGITASLSVSTVTAIKETRRCEFLCDRAGIAGDMNVRPVGLPWNGQELHTPQWTLQYPIRWNRRAARVVIYSSIHLAWSLTCVGNSGIHFARIRIIKPPISLKFGGCGQGSFACGSRATPWAVSRSARPSVPASRGSFGLVMRIQHASVSLSITYRLCSKEGSWRRE